HNFLSGSVGKLVLVVPWSNLKNESVIAKISRVYLICGPNPELHDARQLRAFVSSPSHSRRRKRRQKSASFAKRRRNWHWPRSTSRARPLQVASLFCSI